MLDIEIALFRVKANGAKFYSELNTTRFSFIDNLTLIQAGEQCAASFSNDA